MFSNKSNLTHYTEWDLLLWSSLAFQAGALNIGGFLACHRFVSHLTGFATHFGDALARNSTKEAMSMILVPMFFMVGAMISAFLVDRKIARNQEPNYSLVLFILTLILFFVSYAGINGIFGEFGEPFLYKRDFVLLILLCLACGLQNSMISSASGAIIRTTHLTGYTTDLAISTVRLLTNTYRGSRRHEIKALIIRSIIIGAFILGSMISGIVFYKHQYAGFVLPTIVSVALFLISLKFRLNKNEQNS